MKSYLVSICFSMVLLAAHAARADGVAVEGWSDRGDVALLNEAFGEDFTRSYDRKRPLLPDEEHAFAWYLYDRYSIRMGMGVVMAAVLSPALAGAAFVFGQKLQEMESEENESGMVNVGAGLAAMSYEVLCGVFATASGALLIAGGILAAIFSAKRKKVTGAVGLEIEKRKASGRWNPQGNGIEATLLSGPGGALMLLTSARF